MRKNLGRVVFKAYGNARNTVLYDCSDNENLADWIRYCDEHASIGSDGYDAEDKECLIESGYFEDDLDDTDDGYTDDEYDE